LSPDLLSFNIAFSDIKSDFDSGDAVVEVIIQNVIDEGTNIELIVSQLVVLSPEQLSQIIAAATLAAPGSVV